MFVFFLLIDLSRHSRDVAQLVLVIYIFMYYVDCSLCLLLPDFWSGFGQSADLDCLTDARFKLHNSAFTDVLV